MFKGLSDDTTYTFNMVVKYQLGGMSTRNAFSATTEEIPNVAHADSTNRQLDVPAADFDFE